MFDFKTIKWIFRKTKAQNINFILLNLIQILYSILSIYLILVSKYVIDAATSGSILDLKKYIMQLILISLIEISLRAILSSIDAVTRAKLEISFKQDVLDTIIKRNYEKISKYHSGELLTRISSDVNIIIDTLVSFIPNSLSMITRLFCAIVLLFQISKEFVVILVFGGIILFVVVNFFKPYMKNIHKRVQEANAKVSLFFKEIFENLIVIKIFEAEDAILDKSNELQNSKYNVQMKRRSILIASGTGFNLIFQIGYLYALIWSAYNLYLENITVGGLTAIVQLIAQVQSPIISLSRSFQNIFAMTASAERIIELENLEKDIILDKKDKTEIYENMEKILVKDLSFTYKNKRILESANLSIQKGEILAIYGESGVGKSTLLKLILGIIKKDNGNICFEMKNGEEQLIDNTTRSLFAYVPQGQFILSGTIRENLTFVNRNVTDENIEKALEISESKSFIDNLPDGLETQIGERGKGLSEGQLQRLAIARAIISDAPILILDEITSSLDTQTEEKVLNNIKNLKNKTCIIVTHRESISKICDKQYILKDMKIKEKSI